jgi:hypothetical protein
MTEIATENKSPRYRLFGTKNELNSYLMPHMFNYELIAEEDDLEGLMAFADLNFGKDKAYGLDYMFIGVVDKENWKAPFLRVRVPLADKQFEYFHMLPAHDEIEQYIKPVFAEPGYIMPDGRSVRAFQMDPSLFLEAGQEPLPHHPRHKELLATFNPLTPNQIEAIAKLEEKYLASVAAGNNVTVAKKKRGRTKKTAEAAE